MNAARLALIARDEGGDEVTLAAPKLGIWTGAPAPGTLVGPGTLAGMVRQLDRRYLLVVPDGVAGVVTGSAAGDHARAVAYGEALFRVARQALAASSGATPGASAAGTPGHRVLAPTDGVFYVSPSPGAPPFVSAGGRIAVGQTVGLIEVMKTFNPIPYGGGPQASEGEVVEVLVGDGEEVRAGQPLLVVR